MSSKGDEVDEDIVPAYEKRLLPRTLMNVTTSMRVAIIM